MNNQEIITDIKTEDAHAQRTKKQKKYPSGVITCSTCENDYNELAFIYSDDVKNCFNCRLKQQQQPKQQPQQ